MTYGPPHVGAAFRQRRQSMGLDVYDCALRIAARLTMRDIRRPQISEFVTLARFSLASIEEAAGSPSIADPLAVILLTRDARFMEYATGVPANDWKDIHQNWLQWAYSKDGG